MNQNIFFSKNVTDIWKILPQYFKKYPKAACGMRPRRASFWLTCKQRETNHDTVQGCVGA